MIFLRFIRYLRGYVWFEARGVFVERFLNLVARSRIPIWAGRKKGEVYTGCVMAGDYKQLRPHARKAGIKLRVTAKTGAPFQRRKYRSRTGLLVGLALFAAFIIGMSQFIWRIEVGGNKTVNDTAILQALESLGVEPGARRSSIDVRDCERQMLLLLPDMAWVALNIDGSAIHVEVSESTLPPAMVDPLDPCNVVAGEAGQILSMNVYEGQPLVGIGDTVLPGDIIISGITQDMRGQSLFRHARGQVKAQIQVDLEVDVPLQQTEFVETGKTMKRRYLGIFSGEIPLFLPLQIPSPYRVERTNTPLVLFSLELPVNWLTEEHILMEEVPVTYTEAEAKALAMKELGLLQKVRLEGAEIVDRSVTGELSGQSFLLKAAYICNMDIALEKEIEVSE